MAPRLQAEHAMVCLGHVHVNWLAPAKIRQVVMVGSKRMCIYNDTEPSEKVKIYARGVELRGILPVEQAVVVRVWVRIIRNAVVVEVIEEPTGADVIVERREVISIQDPIPVDILARRGAASWHR